MDLLSCGTDTSVYSSQNPEFKGYEWRIGIMTALRLNGGRWNYPVFSSILDSVLPYLKEKGAYTNKSCGLHVHVSCPIGNTLISYGARAEIAELFPSWKSRTRYASTKMYIGIDNHYSAVRQCEGMNHVEFRTPNGTLNKRGIHHTVQRCLSLYTSHIWREDA